MRCGLLGRKLGHSYSPQIHRELGDYTYCLFEKEPEEIEEFLRTEDFCGINVTVPYKKDVIPYLDELSPVAARLGAVNTVVRRDGKLIGHNTDYFGFLTMVKAFGLDVYGKKALVLGSGGASNTAVAVLKELGANVTIISRNGENNYQNLNLHSDAALIVNTTPVGMYPNTGVSPVDLTQFPKLECVLDVVYNPARTQLLLDAEKLGIPGGNGLLMLVAQAKEAAEWFTGNSIDDAVIQSIHAMLRNRMENIVLIGMPGCGKSTVGKALAARLGNTFVDADEFLVNSARRTIPEIFATDGESAFRSLETAALAKLGKQSGLVIATGGGCVTRPENFPLLHQNSTVFWLTRALEKLPTVGRPLSMKNKLEDLYQLRRPLYEAFADHIIDNNETMEATLDQIIRIREEIT